MQSEFQILFRDEHITVCLKPAGVLSEISTKANVISLIAEATGTDVFPVHRLDRDTAGVMVYANTQRSAAELSKQVQQGLMKKHYYAVVAGSFEDKSGTMEDLLFHDRTKNKTYVVARERKGVKKASLEFTISDSADGYSLADILLHTGRTHQIRVQFASRKHPLWGDAKYGGSTDGGVALFAYKLEFRHPVSGEALCFSALPDVTVKPWSLFNFNR